MGAGAFAYFRLAVVIHSMHACLSFPTYEWPRKTNELELGRQRWQTPEPSEKFEETGEKKVCLQVCSHRRDYPMKYPVRPEELENPVKFPPLSSSHPLRGSFRFLTSSHERFVERKPLPVPRSCGRPTITELLRKTKSVRYGRNRLGDRNMQAVRACLLRRRAETLVGGLRHLLLSSISVVMYGLPA